MTALPGISDTPATRPGDEGKEAYRQLADSVSTVMFGNDRLVRLAVVCMLAGGHLLIEGLPGVGKTNLARALADSLGAKFKRIQMTADLLPSDITGSTVFAPTGADSFQRGPIFANVVLADEINRATPKAQAAMLEAMQEGHVTVDGTEHRLDKPFMVIATQNPQDHEGTYGLPEAELDRFLMRVDVCAPDRESEIRVVRAQPRSEPLAVSHPVLTAEAFSNAVQDVSRLPIDDALIGYAVDIVQATRQHGDLRCGSSPRGSIGLVRAARAWAVSDGASEVRPDHLAAVAHAVLDHRIFLTGRARHVRTAADIVEEILRTTNEPIRNASGRG